MQFHTHSDGRRVPGVMCPAEASEPYNIRRAVQARSNRRFTDPDATLPPSREDEARDHIADTEPEGEANRAMDRARDCPNLTHNEEVEEYGCCRICENDL